MDPQELRPERSPDRERRQEPRAQRPDRPDIPVPRVERPEPRPRQEDPPAAQPSAAKPEPPAPAGQPKRIDRRLFLAAGGVALAALIVPRLFHSNSPLPPPAGQNFDPQYRTATLALQPAPTQPMPATLDSWQSCIGSGAGRRLSDLDLAILVDNTGSMAPVIEDVKVNIGQLISTLRSGGGRVRVGMVAYRDLGDDFLVRPLPLTDIGGPGANAVQAFIGSMQAYGGGDWPEKLDAALQVAADMEWRHDVPASIVVIADAPAHAGDAAAASSAIRSFTSRVRGGQVSVVDTGSGGDAFLRGLPGTGRGQYVTYDGNILTSLYPAITACPSK
jgi:hypothetical protein